MAESDNHNFLKKQAVRWLRKYCFCFSTEIQLGDSQIADAIGIRYTGDIYMIEAKATRADLMSAKQKAVNERLEKNHLVIPDFHYFILEDGVKLADHEYPMWGVLDKVGTVIRRAKRVKRDERYDWQGILEKYRHEVLRNIACSNSFRSFEAIVEPRPAATIAAPTESHNIFE